MSRRWRTRKRKPRPTAEVIAELETAREALARWEFYKESSAQRRLEYERLTGPIEAKVESLKNLKSNYRKTLFGLVKTRHLLPDTEQRCNELKHEIDIRKSEIDRRIPTVAMPPYPNGRHMMSDYHKAVRVLEREMLEAEQRDRVETRKRVQRAIVANATGKSRDLAQSSF